MPLAAGVRLRLRIERSRVIPVILDSFVIEDHLIETSSEPEPITEQDEATISALLNLGYPRAQAERAVRHALEQLGDEPSLEDLIREALRVAAG